MFYHELLLFCPPFQRIFKKSLLLRKAINKAKGKCGNSAVSPRECVISELIFLHYISQKMAIQTCFGDIVKIQMKLHMLMFTLV